MKPRAVLFDAGFTLLDLSETLPERIGRIAGEHGLTVDREAVAAVQPLVMGYLAALPQPNDIYANEAAQREFWNGFYGIAFRHGGVDEVHLPTLLERMYRHNNSSAGWQLYADSLPTLARLKAAGKIVGIISDWGIHLLEHVLIPLGVTAHCDFVIASAVVGLSKPSADIFHLALQRAGVRAEEAVYIGDNYVLDVLGARSAGIPGVLIDRHNAFAGRQFDCPVVTNLDDLLPMVLLQLRQQPLYLVVGVVEVGGDAHAASCCHDDTTLL